jgi:hypothetical protein
LAAGIIMWSGLMEQKLFLVEKTRSVATLIVEQQSDISWCRDVVLNWRKSFGPLPFGMRYF